VLRKFFPLDKNYILEKAQLSMKQSLLNYLIDFVKVEYLLSCNPLGITDETIQRIKQSQDCNPAPLEEFYITLMGVFRFTYYGDNQLQFIFDGQDDFKKYQKEWTEQFKKWTKEFCKHHNFLRAVLDLTVFHPGNDSLHMADNRMNAFISQFFDLKIHPQKGIIKKSA
jgi:hypothetical protein